MKISVKKGINSITDGEKDAIAFQSLIKYNLKVVESKAQ